MSASRLLVEVHLHGDRYHGHPEWPPAPARLFQALVAGAARGTELQLQQREALRWLERLPPPVIGAPPQRAGQRVKLWVPNNDLDARGGDPGRLASIRTGKLQTPRLLDDGVPFLYVWAVPDDPESKQHTEQVLTLCRDLYQFGRGIDMAWAVASWEQEAHWERRSAAYPGTLHQPADESVAGRRLDCPCPGSLETLEARHDAFLGRLQVQRDGRKIQTIFQQPPKPRFRRVAYDSPFRHRLFELRSATETRGSFHPWSPARAVALVESVRDAAATRLTTAYDDQGVEVERAIVGRTPEGASRLAPSLRVRLTPLPSIGHPHADRGIRRLLVQVPAGCPIPSGDVFWAFSGLPIADGAGILVPTEDESMLGHFGFGLTAARYRSVTPVALPVAASRRRIDPARVQEERKDAPERLAEHDRAHNAIRQALRHAGVRVRLRESVVQREPFERKGRRAEAFAAGTRFAKERLWHIEITLERPISGPLTLGDGRFLGLGVLAPVLDEPGIIAFDIVSGWLEGAEPETAARAFRRAVMARAHMDFGTTLPGYVSGHSQDGQPLVDKPHLHFVCDPNGQKLLIVPPHTRDRRPPRPYERRHLRALENAVADLHHVRAGKAGLLELDAPATYQPPMADTWTSVTPYAVNRHRDLGDPTRAVIRDVLRSCRDAGLPPPAVDVHKTHSRRGIGLTATLTLTFPHAITGPILIGRTRFKGGGWFTAAAAH